ncbi:MAG: tetratricopeptide repeat protein [Bradymonadaceae bacterium]|nr:tetratricopeptide repeat protein [Lujinxingiaceae bacterium]
MGEVWRADHVVQGIAVAIKFMTARRARDPKFQAAFREEVRAMARLDHPGIIMVFDCGEVSQEAEEHSQGRIVAGSSYLAMELAASTLQDIDKSRLQWWHVRSILMRILDALAHSHARGVIHRDLKPANVLFVDTGDGPQLKLSDFGLAHAVDDLNRKELFERKVSGTPRFMAPEQIMGRFRDQGPWTDLYAVGCLAYWLSSGEPPFYSGDTEQILRGHLFEALPPLETRVPVPDGFHAWVERMLAKQPGDRFRRSADAAHDLLSLGEPPGPRQPLRRPLPVVAFSTAPIGPEMIEDMGATEIVGATLALPEGDWELLMQGSGVSIGQPAPLPESWRFTQPPRRSMALVGVGLGLFGLRQIPLVGRTAERDRIWSALAEVHSQRRPRALILRGMAGTGKTRLAEWIAERAHEVGAASILKAMHGPITGPGDGVARMLSNYLRCTGLPREQILERVRYIIALDGPMTSDDLHECLALTEFVVPTADPDFDESKVRVRFTNPTERHIVLKRLLSRITRRRPVIVCLDDVQWGHDSLGFVHHLLNASATPVLFLLTVREEALLNRPIARQQLEALVALDNVEELSVGALGEDDHVELVQHLLGLEEALARQVAKRTDGNPLFAVQLVGDWVERGLLEVGATGFRLQDGENAALPEDVRQLLFSRIEQLIHQPLSAPPNDALLALELAAALGQEIEQREWTQICRQQGIRVPDGLVEAMASNRLAQIDRQGWTFAHGALRECLEHIAREARRWTRHQRACAEMLTTLYGLEHHETAYRLGRHLLEADDLEAALAPILRGAIEHRVTCDFQPANALFDLYEQTLQKLGLQPNDPRAVTGAIERAVTLNRQGKYVESTALLDDLEPLVRASGQIEPLAQILHVRGIVAKMSGQIREGVVIAEAAMELFTAIDHKLGMARCIFLLAEFSYWCGDMKTARDFYDQAWTHFVEIGIEDEMAACKMAMGSLYTKLEDYPQAISFIMEAMAGFEKIGDSNALANCFNNLGEIYRYQGDLPNAELYYDKALRTLERVGLGDDIVVCFNLGMVLMAQAKFAQADPIMRQVLTTLLPTRRGGYIGLAHMGMLPGCAARADWTAWDHHVSEAALHLEQSAMIDIDLAQVAEMAAQLARDGGQSARAREAFDLALNQWRALGREDRITEIEAQLEALP